MTAINKCKVKALLSNKLKYRGNGRAILMQKSRLLETMNPKQTENLFKYLRDKFLEMHVPTAINDGFSRNNKSPEVLTRQKYKSVVTVTP